MHDLADTLRCWQANGEAYALATITATTGSTPRRPARRSRWTSRATSPAACPEAASTPRYTYSAKRCCAPAEPVTRHFIADPDDPFAPSLMCGGTIEVEMRRVEAHEDPFGRPGGGDADERPRMLIFGAVQFADALAAAGKFLGYRVTVCDARPVFATRERHPRRRRGRRRVAAPLSRDAPRSASDTAICVLTHDPKFDVPGPAPRRCVPRPDTSARSARGAPAPSGRSGCAKQGSASAGVCRGCARRSASTSAAARLGRSHSPSAPRSSPRRTAAPACRCVTRRGRAPPIRRDPRDGGAGRAGIRADAGPVGRAAVWRGSIRVGVSGVVSAA